MFCKSKSFRLFPVFFFLVLSLLPVKLIGQDYFGLKEIISGTYPVIGSSVDEGVKPELLELNSMGGVLEASVKFKSGANRQCTGKYRFEWKFSKAVDQLTVGESIDINHSASSIGSSCSGTSAKMIVMDGVGNSPEFKSTGVTRISGISVSKRKWISAAQPAQVSTAKATVLNTSNQHATIKLNFDIYGPIGSERMHYEVVYLFERGYQKTINCDPDINCHNLYSLGVLIGFAEFGALMDQESSLVAANLSGAIEQAIASKCVPEDEIIKLRNKVKSTSSSKTYYLEISALRQEIAQFVESNCNCCR